MIRVGRTRNLLRASSSLSEIWPRSAHHHLGQRHLSGRTNRPDKSPHSITCLRLRNSLQMRAASTREGSTAVPSPPPNPPANIMILVSNLSTLEIVSPNPSVCRGFFGSLPLKRSLVRFMAKKLPSRSLAAKPRTSGCSLRLGWVRGLTPILNLSDRIALEIVCGFVCGNLDLLASKIARQGVCKSRGFQSETYAGPRACGGKRRCSIITGGCRPFHDPGGLGLLCRR